ECRADVLLMTVRHFPDFGYGVARFLNQPDETLAPLGRKGRSLHMLHLSDMRAETVTHAEDALPAAALLASRIRKDLHQLVHIFMNRRPVGMAADDRANLSRQEVERRRQRLEGGR